MVVDQQPGPEAARQVSEITDALAELDVALADGNSLDQVLQLCAEHVAMVVPGADVTSVTVVRGGTWATGAWTSEEVLAVDQGQYDSGAGPCLEAARTSQMVRAGLTEAEQRWPAFTQGARAAGLESYLSCPLLIDEQFAGSLNLYSKQPDGFADFDEALLRLYATVARSAIAAARQYARARDLTAQLHRALETRAVIDQAIGVLMTRRGVPADQAFAELSRWSQNTNIKLRDIAAQLVKNPRQPLP